jgi:FKBP-type peptidyl-prolyl cis-trans isomerase
MDNFRPLHTAIKVLAASVALGNIPAGPAAATTNMEQPAANAALSITAQDGSYDIGLVLGTQLVSNGLAKRLSRDALIHGIDDALAGKIASSAQRDAAQQFSRGVRETLAAQNAKLAHDFLEKNAREKGVMRLPSGLQYRILTAGDPKSAPPGPLDQVSVRYRASLQDGTEFDRSADHMQPALFRLSSVIQGWREALSAMKPGAKWQVFVPPELGYGAHPPSPIPPGSLLIYELELLQVSGPPPMPRDSAPRIPMPSAGS